MGVEVEQAQFPEGKPKEALLENEFVCIYNSATGGRYVLGKIRNGKIRKLGI